jgi:hypothetical protein
MDVIHKRRPQVAATTLALNSFSWPRRGTNEVSIKPGPKSCVQGGWVTRSSLPLLTQTLPALKPWPPNFSGFIRAFGKPTVWLAAEWTYLAQRSTGTAFQCGIVDSNWYGFYDWWKIAAEIMVHTARFDPISFAYLLKALNVRFIVRLEAGG